MSLWSLASAMLLLGACVTSPSPDVLEAVCPERTTNAAATLPECEGVDHEDLFGNNFLMCPTETEGPLCPEPKKCGPDSSPGGGEMSGVNKLPDFLFPDMFAESELFEICRELFDDVWLTRATSRILSDHDLRSQQPESGLRLAMKRVFEHIGSWSYCTATRRRRAAFVHAYYSPTERAIVLYDSVCHAKKMYDVELGGIAAGHRLHWVAAHEVGHVVDELAGELKRPGRELRATYYGSLLAECASRVFRAVFKDAIPLEFSRERECQDALLRRAEKEFARVRDAIRLGSVKTKEAINGHPSCVGL